MSVYAGYGSILVYLQQLKHFFESFMIYDVLDI